MLKSDHDRINTIVEKVFSLPYPPEMTKQDSRKDFRRRALLDAIDREFTHEAEKDIKDTGPVGTKPLPEEQRLVPRHEQQDPHKSELTKEPPHAKPGTQQTSAETLGTRHTSKPSGGRSGL